MKIKKSLVGISIVSILSLTGCTQNQFNDLTGSITDTLSGIIVNDSGTTGTVANSDSNSVKTTSTTKQASQTTGTFTLTVNKDVDTVFAAMVNEFEFPSPQRLRQIAGDDADYYMMDGYYHYESNPGAMYYLGYSNLSHKGKAIALKMKLLKSGNSTNINGEYIYFVQSKTVKNELVKRIKDSLK